VAWPELSVDDFPPRRDDEPSSLRQEIIDELSDHFACALNRELHKNPDEQLARGRVLEQFGDPIKVARQLWLEAMKEKIMSQRILTGVAVVMAVCGFIVVGLVWSMMKESQAFNNRMMAQMAEIAKRPEPVTSDEVNQQILKQLEQLNQKTSVEQGTVATGMNQLAFQLVAEDQDERLPHNYAGTLTKTGDRSEEFTLEAVSNGRGMLDF
jgi:multidrug efflux pump subunit AcrB